MTIINCKFYPNLNVQLFISTFCSYLLINQECLSVEI